jgi:hypothetical protein
MKTVLTVAAALLAIQAFAQAPNVPPIRIEIVGVADGPFRETRIFKLRDRENSATCYVYVPQHINVGHTCPPSGPCVPVVNSALGGISCVKDTPAK